MRRLLLLPVVLVLTACTGTPAPASTTNTTTRTPLVVPAATFTDAPVVDSLLARPLRLPRLAAGERCPVALPVRHSRADVATSWVGLGRAPVYPMGSGTLWLNEMPIVDGLYVHKLPWYSDGGHTGPVVVRVARLDGPGRGVVRYRSEAYPARGDVAVFRLYGIPAGYPSTTEVSGAGCYAYRIDGVGFSEVVPFRVVRA